MLKMKTSCGNKLIINFRSEKPIPKPFWPSVVKCLMFFTDDCAKNYSIQYSFLCTVLLHASGHFSHEFGHHASREANVTWQILEAACICLAQYSAYQAKKHS